MARALTQFTQPDTVWTWRRRVLGSGLPSETRHVLLTVAHHMRDIQRDCYTAPRNLMAETGLPKETVVRALREAVEAGLIEVLAVETNHLQVTRLHGNEP